MDENNADELLLDAVIVPHRSLSARGFVLLMATLCVVSAAAGIMFMAKGAWPVFGFFGLDAVLIYLAFRANYRAGRAREEVRVSREELRLSRFAPDGRLTSEVSLNPYWVKLDVTRDIEARVESLSLVSHGRRHDLAAAVGPAERADFAAALGAALSAARR